jgi:hypothetical protein
LLVNALLIRHGVNRFTITLLLSDFEQFMLTQICESSMNMMDKACGQIVQPATPIPAPSRPSHPLDGSQYHNVIEEQVYAELPPTAEEQMPRRARHLAEPDPVQHHPDDPAISVGLPSV